MSFSYHGCDGTQDNIDFVRVLIPDTTEFDPQGNRAYLFEDSEILGFYRINANVFQSSMFYSPPAGVASLQTPPTSYLRVAALALDSVAGSAARLAGMMRILDVQADTSKAAQALRAQAQEYRDVEDNSGAIVIIEQVRNWPTFRDRFWKQVQRQVAPA